MQSTWRPSSSSPSGVHRHPRERPHKNRDAQDISSGRLRGRNDATDSVLRQIVPASWHPHSHHTHRSQRAWRGQGARRGGGTRLVVVVAGAGAGAAAAAAAAVTTTHLHRPCFTIQRCASRVNANVQDICDSTTGAINRVLKSARRKAGASLRTGQALARTLAGASKINGLVVL